MRDECQHLLDNLGNIPKQDLLRVKNSITAYLANTQKTGNGGGSASVDPFSVEEGLLLDSLLEVLESLGLQARLRRRLINSSVFKTNWEKSRTVITWASQVHDRLSRKLLYDIALKRLYVYLCDGVPIRWDPENKFLTRNRGGVVGVREMLIFLDYIPSVMEAQFPGYREAGLLKLIPVSVKNRSLDVREKQG